MDEDFGPMARVRFLDLGTEQWETARKLKRLPDGAGPLRTEPPTAERAAIHGIYPAAGGKEGVAGGWRRDAVKEFAGLVQRGECLLDVHGMEGDKLMVDLWTKEHDARAAISVKMTMVFRRLVSDLL